DRNVIPEDDRKFYVEKVAYLPDCYQPNDDKRREAGRFLTRAAAGLPERAFVFCCFNNCYKLTSEIFDVWMRLLKQVDGRLLWLLDSFGAVPANLRREAVKRGITPERIVFSPYAKNEIHLARHGLCDLFLDTLPYNAHTTASDALWAGLPVVT